MSQPNGKNNGSDAFVDSSSLLLKEYVQKLTDLCEQSLRIRHDLPQTTNPASLKSLRLELELLMTRFRRLKPAATKLAQIVSQRLEHGKLELLEQAELGLRLAEFESALAAADKISQTPIP